MKMVGYLMKKFLPIFFGALTLFTLILLLTDLFMNIWGYISQKCPAKTVALIELYYVPKVVWYATPMAMLFATAYTLSQLYAKNELLAVFASGISLLKFTMPLLVIAMSLSFGLFFFEDKVVVPTFANKKNLQDTALARKESLNKDKIVIRAESGNIIYKAEFFDYQLKRLTQVYLVFRDDENNLKCVIRADNAYYQEGTGNWSLSNGYQYTPTEDGYSVGRVQQEYLDLLTESPETFKNNTVSVEAVNSREAKQYIEHLRKAGLPYAEELSVYYKKFSFPFIVFIVAFLAIGLSGKTRKNVLVISLGLSILSVVIFYVIQMVTMLMAKYEVISPFMGAWFPVIFFIFVSMILMKFAKT